MPVRVIVLLGVAAFLAGCAEVGEPTAPTMAPSSSTSATSAPTPTGTQQPGIDLPFRALETGTSSGIETTGFESRVLRNQAAWEAFWAEHKSKTSEPGTPPAVDFPREVAVALFLGQKPSSGYAIEVVRVAFADNGNEVHYATTQPGNGCGTLAVITEPFQVVAFEPGVDDGTVRFLRGEERTRDCGSMR